MYLNTWKNCNCTISRNVLQIIFIPSENIYGYSPCKLCGTAVSTLVNPLYHSIIILISGGGGGRVQSGEGNSRVSLMFACHWRVRAMSKTLFRSIECKFVTNVHDVHSCIWRSCYVCHHFSIVGCNVARVRPRLFMCFGEWHM